MQGTWLTAGWGSNLYIYYQEREKIQERLWLGDLRASGSNCCDLETHWGRSPGVDSPPQQVESGKSKPLKEVVKDRGICCQKMAERRWYGLRGK